MTPDPAAERRDPVLTTTDLLALVPVVLVALAGTAALALAHVHRHSLHGVALLTAAGAAVLLAAMVRLGGRPRVVVDGRGTAIALAAGALAAFMFFPGFSYGVADKDPGVYVAHAIEISRNASVDFTDEALAKPGLPVELTSPGARFAGIWVREGTRAEIFPQFYHLWPALLAVGHDAGGVDALRATTPLLGVLAVLCVVALLRRLGGLWAAGIGGLLLSTNMIQVWGAKFPATEILAEALFVGALLAAAVAVQTRWRALALVAGLLAGTGFLARPDGWLVVALAAAALAALYASRRDDRLAAWGAVGLAVSLPFAIWQAYFAAEAYTTANVMPSLAHTALLLGGLAAGAVLARRLLAGPIDRLVGLLATTRRQRVAGAVVTASAAALIVLGYLRPALFGELHYESAGQILRSYDEENLHRLTWFFTAPGIVLAWAGVATVALRRWRAAAWVLVAPALVVVPVFAYESHVASRLMWWTRRYASNVTPTLVMLIALALAFAMAWRYRGRRVLLVPALAATAALAGVFLSQSLPLRDHDEWRGSFAVAREVAELAGPNQGVFLWQRPSACCFEPTQLWAVPVWLAHGQLSVLLPGDEARQLEYVRAYRRAFPDRPLFVVWNGLGAPGWRTQAGLADAAHMGGTMPFWEESDAERPRRAREIPYALRVFRVPDR